MDISEDATGCVVVIDAVETERSKVQDFYVAEFAKGLLILSQPEVCARDSLPLAYAAGQNSVITFWQFYKINKPPRISTLEDNRRYRMDWPYLRLRIWAT